MGNTQAIHFIDYEKISDILMYFSREVTLNFNVILAYKQNDNNRSHFHREYLYSSTKYMNKSNLLSIKRNFSYNLSIDIRNNMNNVIINQCNMIALKMKLKIVYNWFTTLFKHLDDKIIISGTWNENILYLNKYSIIKFEPTICIYSDNTYKPGVRLYLNDDSVYVDLDIDRFMELYYFIDNFNMYQSAITLLNYIAPKEYGINLTTLNMENNINNNVSIDDASTGGFFNKINKNK